MASETTTESEWMTTYSRGVEMLKAAESLRDNAKATVDKITAEDISGKFSEAQAKAIAESLTAMATAQGLYMKAETTFKDARSAFKQEMKNLKKQARAKSIDVPESVEKMGNQLDDIVKHTGAQAKHIDRWLKSVEKAAR
eukprot:CAMPEP_0115182574 /NCGR_PEP_ID=MMETSP0270-20121206/8013_1 /TAXON_ID=71861 /ORGANISM="Scrippsiella trochoidea, Strain CCMP3099" /LENGTH=139 /DNA_ID=CAMNT_0002595625 /DNA_START=214 /DNA_END=633 /DNA_ORIENTATION=+